MRILASLAALCLLTSFTSCITWKGAGVSSLSAHQREMGIEDVHVLARNYEINKYWSDTRARYEGRNNALGRGLANIQATFDRHFWNYSRNDPYVNYQSDVTTTEHLLRFFGGMFAR
jgi:hypothetical protein